MSFQTKARELVNPQLYWAGCTDGANCGGNPAWSGRQGCEDDGDDRRCLQWPNGGKGYCPQYGTLTTATWQGDNSQRIKCTYSGIDAAHVWDPAVSDDFETSTVASYRRDFCLKITDPQVLSSTNQCIGALGGQDQFDGQLITLCGSKDNWASIPACFGAVKRSAQRGDANSTKAGDAIRTFCRGGTGTDAKAMGPNRSKPECACVNARDFGFKPPAGTSDLSKTCLADDKKTLPGCDKLNTRLGGLVEGGGPGLQVIEAITNDAGCLSSDCADANTEDSSNRVLPYEAADVSCPAVDINVCNVAISQKVGYNSPILANCNFPPAQTNSAAPGSAAAGGAPGSAPGSGPSASDSDLLISWKPFANVFNTPTKQMAFFSSCCATCIILIVIMMFMMKAKAPAGPSGSNLALAKLASL